MPSLRDLRDRVKSVKSTKKITAAMKMVAASKLRRAQEQAEKSHPYSASMATALERVTHNIVVGPDSSPLLTGTGSEQRHMLVVVSSDRGLCGGFNSRILKHMRAEIRKLHDAGKEVQIVCIGRKGYDSLRTDFKSLIVKTFFDVTSQKRIPYGSAQNIRDFIVTEFFADKFDVCTLIYSDFKSVMIQEPTSQQLIPFELEQAQEKTTVAAEDHADEQSDESQEQSNVSAPYQFEPDEESIINILLPRNVGVQLYRAMLDSSAGEQASRMTAMDSATRNASDMIDNLTLQYNRARQAYITKELIEIISGAEAV